MAIHWYLQRKQIKDLIPHSKNPRQISKEKAQQLADSIAIFGLIDKPIINYDNTIIGGHQRIKLLANIGEDFVECWVPDEYLCEKQVDKLNISLNKITGDWDYDILANEWDQEDLLDAGFTEKELFVTDIDIEESDELPKEKEETPKLCDRCKKEIK